jgi:hypothetical protein
MCMGRQGRPRIRTSPQKEGLSPAKKTTDIEQRGSGTKRDGPADFRNYLLNPVSMQPFIFWGWTICASSLCTKPTTGRTIMLGSRSGEQMTGIAILINGFWMLIETSRGVPSRARREVSSRDHRLGVTYFVLYIRRTEALNSEHDACFFRGPRPPSEAIQSLFA